MKEPKKKILFVNKSFVVGGIQSSMLNLINELKDEYDVDVCVFYNGGQLKYRLPEGVNVIKTNKLLQLHGMSVGESKKINVLMYLIRLFLGAFDRLFTNRLFFSLALMMQKKLKGYDAVIAYHHEDSTNAVVSGFYRFVDKKTDAPVKLGWIHYDPYKISYDDRKNEKYMERMSKIICVSKGTASEFKRRHPDLSVPVDYCYNVQDISRIITLSKEDMGVEFSGETFNCFSACRFGPQKAIPRAVRAFAPVLKEYSDVRWYIAGDGDDMKEVKKLITEYKLEDSVVLLGMLSNPYPYFTKSNLYIQPSKYEAAPMVYGEAMICKTPILTTDNISAHEMVSPEFGMICENSEEGLRDALFMLMEHRELVVDMKRNLEANQYSNKGIVEKLDSLFNGE